MTKTILLGMLALLCLAMAIFPSFFYKPMLGNSKPTEKIAYTLNGQLLSRGCPACSPGEPSSATLDIDVDYKPTVPESDSFIVTLNIKQFTSEEDVFVSLTATNFDIKPIERQLISAASTNTDEVTSLKWNLQARGLGKHFVLLDIRELFIHENSDGYFTATKLEGPDSSQYLGDRKSATDAFIELPIEVVTVWGISNKSYLIVRGLFGFVGFVLATPVLYNFFIKKSKSANQSP